MKVYTAKTTSELSLLVASLVGDNPLEKTAVFCEDKFTLALELAIAKRHGGSFGVNVYSFNRYMHKYLEEDKTCLSQESSALVVKRLLLENKNKLECFKKVYEPNLASAVYELIAQLKSAKVTPYDLEKACEESIGNLKRKLKDLTLIFFEYERFLNENGLTDGNNRLYRLPEFFESNQEIKQTKVVIAGFPSLNKTLCEIFKALVRNAKDVCFAVVAGENSSVYTNETFKFANDEFNPQIINGETSFIKEKLLNSFFVPGFEINNQIETDSVYCFKAKNLHAEIEQVAKSIKKQVLSGGKYKHFCITCENICDYELIIKNTFADYEIPYFIDQKINLSKHPITRLVCSYIDVVKSGFDTDKVLQFVKNPYFTPDKQLADNFENYYISYAINRKTVKHPFTYQDDFLLEYEILRQKLINVCSFLNEKQNFSQAVCAIKKMMTELKVEEINLSLSNGLGKLNREELKSFNEQGINKFYEVIDQAVGLLGEHVFPLAEVKNIILSGMTSSEIPLICEYNDCVFVGDFRAVKYGNYQTVFAVGLCDGVPSNKLDTALLCDREIDKMKQSDVLVEPKIKEVNRRTRETACMALTAFNNRLILSYPAQGVDGKEKLPCEIFERVKNLFVLPEKYNNQIVTDYEILAGGYITKRKAIMSFAKAVNDFKEGKDNSQINLNGASAYYGFVKEQAQDESTVNGAIDQQMQNLNNFLNVANSEIGYYKEGVNYAEKGLSATAIEGYYSCPYKNFLSRGLKLQERLKSSIMANDLGTMVHTVAENFVKEVDFNKDLNCALKLAGDIFEKVVSDDKYSRYLQSASGKKSFGLIKKECLRFCADLFGGVVNSSFKPKEIEIDFGGFGKKSLPAIKVNTKTHGVKEITGKVDRIDQLFNKETKEFEKQMRIVDYKTGMVDEAKIEENLFSGEKLQLFLYAKAFENRYQPVGVYYFPISDDFVKTKESTVMPFAGRTLQDIAVARQLDYTITPEKPTGDYVTANFTITKNGEFRYPSKHLTKREISAFSNYALKVAGNALEQINSGFLVATPTEGSCKYCKYHGICGYDISDNKDRVFSGITKKTVAHATYLKVFKKSDALKISQNAIENLKQKGIKTLVATKKYEGGNA